MTSSYSRPSFDHHHQPDETDPLTRTITTTTTSSSRPPSSIVLDEPSPSNDTNHAANGNRLVVHSKRDDWSFWLLGAVILLSWNVIICTLPLFQALLPPTSGLRHTLPSYITTVYTLGNFGFLGIAQRGVGKVSQSKRLRISLYSLLLLTILTTFPLISLIFPILSPTPFLILLITLTLFFSLATSFLQSSVIALAALHGSKELLCVLSGQGGVAVVISSVQLYIAFVTAWGSKTDDDGDDRSKQHRPPLGEGKGGVVSKDQLRSGLGLWAISTIPVILCILTARRLLVLDDGAGGSRRRAGGGSKGDRLFGRSRSGRGGYRDSDGGVGEDVHARLGDGLDDAAVAIGDEDDDGQDTSFDRQTNGPTPSEERELRFVAEEDEDTSRINSIGLSRHHSGRGGLGAQDGMDFKSQGGLGFRKSARWRGDDGMGGLVWRHRVVYFSIAWVFVVTLAVFPPITTTILSVHEPPTKFLAPSVFLPLHFLIFNVSDYIGRTFLPARPGFLITSHRKLLLASLGRTLFIPLFLMCNTVFQPEAPGGLGSKAIINSDLAYLAILFAFGASNGYISSLGMILASSPTLNPLVKETDKDVSGALAGFCLTAGLAVGSMMSFLVRWVVRGGNPFVD